MVITLEESTTDSVSPVLETIVKNVTSENKTSDSIQKDCLLILLLVSMNENGFVLLDHDCEIFDLILIDAKQINKWKSQLGVFEVPLFLNGFKNIQVTLIMSTLGAMALINVIIKDLGETYSVCLPMSKYVAAPLATTIPMMFRDLKHFSMCFKNKVISAVKSKILYRHGCVSASLVGLSEDLLFKIMFYLPLACVVTVSKTCTALRNILQSNRFWFHIMKRDFKSSRANVYNAECDWKEVYKSFHQVHSEKDLTSQTATSSMHDYIGSSDSYYDNPVWNLLL